MPEVRTLSRAWRWILVLGPMLVVAIAFWSLWSLREAAGRPDSAVLAAETDHVAQLVDAYIKRVVGVTSLLAVAPDVVGLAEASTARSVTGADAAAQAHWDESANAESDPFARIRKQPVSSFFADLKAADGAYREIFLADRQGRLIAASNRTEDFQQADDLWWPKNLDQASASCRRLPMDCVQISDIDWDSSAGLHGYDVVLPVVTADGRTVGVLKAVVDPKELERLLDFAEFNRELDVELVNGQGTQVFSSKPFFGEKAVRKLQDLTPGSEGSLALGDSREKGPVVSIRRLSSPVAGGWFIAVADRHHGEDGLWKTYLLWCLFTLGMFLIAAGAFAIRIPARADASEERATA